MERRFRLILLAAVLAATVTACSSQKSVATASSGATCDIDAKKMCEADTSLENMIKTGEFDDAQQFAANTPRTASYRWIFSMPNGTLLEIQCDINTEHHRIVYAHLLSGPKLSVEDIDYLHNQGLCKNEQ